MPNVELHPKHKLTAMRKLGLGTWRTSYDSQVYGTMQIPMDAVMDYIKRFRKATGRHLTVTHLMAKAAAGMFEVMPDANAILRFNRPYRRKEVNIFFQVALPGKDGQKPDLSGTTLYNVDKMSLIDIVDEFERKVELVRARKDPDLENTRKSFAKIPPILMGPVLRLVSFLGYTLNLRIPGVPKDAFGSMMITNVGALGLDVAYVPIVPYSRAPILLATGIIKDVTAVEDGEIVIRKVMPVSATFDHRFIDGQHAAVMSKVMHQWFAEPDEHFGSIE